MSTEHYDIIITRTGAGGGTLTYRLDPSGKKFSILERGAFLPQEKENWDTVEVYQKDRYHTSEVWIDDQDGSKIHQGTGYWVGEGHESIWRCITAFVRKRFRPHRT